MSFPWHEIHDHLARTSSTLSFQHDFRALQRMHPSLTRFTDPAGLLDALHRGTGSPEEKNRLLAALVEAAQSDRLQSDCALTVMLLALWPGLDAVRRRANRRRLDYADELASDVLARATEAIRCLDLGRVSRIAATVLRNIERDLIRARQNEADRASLQADTDPAEIAVDHQHRTPERLHCEVQRLIGADANLVIRVAVEGFSQAEVAVELGLSEAAARKRYQRASRRLRDALHEFA